MHRPVPLLLDIDATLLVLRLVCSTDGRQFDEGNNGPASMSVSVSVSHGHPQASEDDHSPVVLSFLIHLSSSTDTKWCYGLRTINLILRGSLSSHASTSHVAKAQASGCGCGSIKPRTTPHAGASNGSRLSIVRDYHRPRSPGTPTCTRLATLDFWRRVTAASISDRHDLRRSLPT